MALRLFRSVSLCPKSSLSSVTLTPFLYPSSVHFIRAQRLDFFIEAARSLAPSSCRSLCSTAALKQNHHAGSEQPGKQIVEGELLSVQQSQHPHSTYSTSPFSDLRVISLSAGSGGHGCVSFLREKFVPNGPANGGDGGGGGSIYIQAVYGETSLHKIARDGAVQATAGRNGQGSAVNGKRGDDVIIRVPVGTIVREISRWDPAAEELGLENAFEEQYTNVEVTGEGNKKHGENENWLHYPRSLSQNLQSPQFMEAAFPFHHHRSSSELLAQTHPTPVYLDLSEPTMQPILLLPGAPGGFGNPHFVSNELRRPKFATKGGKGARMKIQLELKILADVGLVGLPNAGKSSFLRSVSRKRARVGEWAFTTLSPNIGTIVLDERLQPQAPAGSWERLQYPRFTIADIPGLISDAHLNKGLGHGFLRHVERAKILGFVLDLSRDNPVGDLEDLWREVKAYEQGSDENDENGSIRGMMNEMAGNINIDVDLIKQSNIGHGEGCSEEGWRVADEEGCKTRETEGMVREVKGMTEREREQIVCFPGVGAFLPRREAPRCQKGGGVEEPGLGLDTLYPRQKRPNMSSKPWFVIANKADLPGTEEKYWVLKKYLEAEVTKKNGRDIGLIPISALREQGVEKVVDWMKGMLGF